MVDAHLALVELDVDAVANETMGHAVANRFHVDEAASSDAIAEPERICETMTQVPPEIEAESGRSRESPDSTFKRLGRKE